MIRLVLIASICCAARAASAVPCASWKTAEKDLRSAWAKGYPKEKLISLEQAGEPSEYDKLTSTNQEKIDEYGDKWEAYAKQTFCRVPAKALVEQAGGQRKFDVSAIYVVKGSRYVWDDIGVGESEAVAGAGQGAPSKDEIKKLIAASYAEGHSDVKVEQVKCSDPELKSYQQRWWYVTGADIFIADSEGKKQKCSSDMVKLFKGEKEHEGGGGPWHVEFVITPSCDDL